MVDIRKWFSSDISDSLAGVVSVAIVGMILGKFFRYLINFVIATGLNAEILGYFTFGLVLVRAGSVIASLGLRTASQRFISVSNQEGDQSALIGSTIISLVTPLVVGGVVGILLYAVWPEVSAMYGFGIGEEVRVFFLAIPLYATMMVGATATRGFKQTKYYVYIRELGQSGVAIGLIAVASYWLASTEAVVFSYFVSLIIGCGLVVWYLFDLGALRIDVAPQFQPIKMFKISLPLMIVAGSQYLISWTDILMLGTLTTSVDVGYYQVAFLYAALLYIAFQAINSIFPSMAAGLYADGELNELRNTYSLVTKWGIYITSIGTLVVVVYAEPLLRLFGTEYTVATTTLIVLAVGRSVASLPGPASFILSMSEYEKTESVNTVLFAITNLLLNYALIPKYGIIGAGIATSVSLVGMNFARLAEVWWYLDLHPFHLGYSKGVISLTLAAVTIYICRTFFYNLVGAFVAGLLATIVFGIVLLRLGLDEQDRRLFSKV